MSFLSAWNLKLPFSNIFVLETVLTFVFSHRILYMWGLQFNQKISKLHLKCSKSHEERNHSPFPFRIAQVTALLVLFWLQNCLSETIECQVNWPFWKHLYLFVWTSEFHFGLKIWKLFQELLCSCSFHLFFFFCNCYNFFHTTQIPVVKYSQNPWLFWNFKTVFIESKLLLSDHTQIKTLLSLLKTIHKVKLPSGHVTTAE